MGGLIYAVILSVPFYFIWNRLAPIYFRGLPPQYQHIPFGHCAGLFVLIAIARAVLLPSRRK
jgi:hypothetical protein